MNISVRTAAGAILTLLLIAGLSSCSTSEPRPVTTTTGEPQKGTIAEAEPDEAARSASQKAAAAASVRADHPRQYTVKKGDTLWDIAGVFLEDPWYWPEIWYENPDIDNPHLIYPGDILTLVYVDGVPRILVGKPVHKTDKGGPLPVRKLSPEIRTESIEASIDTIPGDAIRQFLSKPRVVTKEELEAAPYIIGSDDDHLVLGSGMRVYVRGELDKERVRYTVFRAGDKLVDPDTEEVYGYEAIYAGEAHISRYGDPAIGSLTFTEREVLIGDRLLPTDKSKISNLYYPRPPESGVQGKIIHLSDALFGIAKLQVAVVNLGARDGLEPGHLLATYASGAYLKDRYDQDGENINIKLPDERSGLMMLFRTFDEVSYGLVLESTRVIHRKDVVKTP